MDLGDTWNRLDRWTDSMENEPFQDVTLVDEILDMDFTGTSALAAETTGTRRATDKPAYSWAANAVTTKAGAASTARREADEPWECFNFNQPAGRQNKIPPGLRSKSALEAKRKFELYRLHSVGFEMNEGDTLVFIDFPSPSKASKNKADCNGIAYNSQQFRVHSANLLETESSKFAEMLGPTYQFRVLRRRKLVNKLPADVKYVLDLTPPSEGDELVFQMTELSLTPGIIKWWSSSMLHVVDSCLVTGHDDVCICDRLGLPLSSKDKGKVRHADENPDEQGSPAPEYSDSETATKNPFRKSGRVAELPFTPELILRMKARQENETYETPDYRRIPEYCPYRHRNGILRLLMLIEGKGTTFDSACRVWTMVKLSQMFDCSSAVRDLIAQWIMHGPNSRFIEVLPEEALQIAFALRLPAVAQCAFRILVNEFALMEADSQIDRKSAQVTTFGRKLGDLPDELSNLVQHAARALIERISDLEANLRNQDMFDFWNISEWNRLRAIEQLLTEQGGEASTKALGKLQQLMEALVYKITYMFDQTTSMVLSVNSAACISIDEDRATYVEPKDFDKLTFIMRRMNPIQMLLCSLTYNELGSSLEGKLYWLNSCQFPGRKAITYSYMVAQTAEALQEVFNESPTLAFAEAWKPCFDIDVPAQFNKHNARKVRTPLVRLVDIESDVKNRLRPIALSWIRHDIEPPLNITRHLLLTLTNNEMKFMPLWAGGCDDGTGGVFETRIPPAAMGPSGPGPSYHTGMTIPSLPSSGAGSMMEDLADLRLTGSTTAGSVDVHDSVSTVYRDDRVIVDDESMASEAFTSEGTEYRAARYLAVDMVVGDDDESRLQSMVADREETPGAADEDMDFWNEESDSDDDSVVMVEKEHGQA